MSSTETVRSAGNELLRLVTNTSNALAAPRVRSRFTLRDFNSVALCSCEQRINRPAEYVVFERLSPPARPIVQLTTGVPPLYGPAPTRPGFAHDAAVFAFVLCGSARDRHF